jgi:Fur family ferric uptake transcriptional regulator
MVTEYVTRPREQIAEILNANKQYLTAAEIHTRLTKTGHKVALSTVYRTLDHLLGKGQVNARTDADGETAYISCAGAHHHHAICRTCGKVEDVDCGAIDAFAESLRADNGFQLEDHAMEFFGTCKACR